MSDVSNGPRGGCRRSDRALSHRAAARRRVAGRRRVLPRSVQAEDFDLYLERTVALHKRPAAAISQVNNPRFALPDRVRAIRLLLNGHAKDLVCWPAINSSATALSCSSLASGFTGDTEGKAVPKSKNALFPRFCVAAAGRGAASARRSRHRVPSPAAASAAPRCGTARSAGPVTCRLTWARATTSTSLTLPRITPASPPSATTCRGTSHRGARPRRAGSTRTSAAGSNGAVTPATTAPAHTRRVPGSKCMRYPVRVDRDGEPVTSVSVHPHLIRGNVAYDIWLNRKDVSPVEAPPAERRRVHDLDRLPGHH